MSEQVVRDILVVLLGAGGATFIWTVSRSYIALRDSAESREDRAVARLERYEQTCREQLAWEREWGAYWMLVAGRLRHALASNGIPEPPLPRKPTGPKPAPDETPPTRHRRHRAGSRGGAPEGE